MHALEWLINMAAAHCTQVSSIWQWGECNCIVLRWMNWSCEKPWSYDARWNMLEGSYHYHHHHHHDYCKYYSESSYVCSQESRSMRRHYYYCKYAVCAATTTTASTTVNHHTSAVRKAAVSATTTTTTSTTVNHRTSAVRKAAVSTTTTTSTTVNHRYSESSYVCSQESRSIQCGSVSTCVQWCWAYIDTVHRTLDSWNWLSRQDCSHSAALRCCSPSSESRRRHDRNLSLMNCVRHTALIITCWLM